MPTTIDLNALSTGLPPPGGVPPVSPSSVGGSPINSATAGSGNITNPSYIQQPVQIMQPVQPVQPTSSINVTINDKGEQYSIGGKSNIQKDSYSSLKFINGLCLIAIGIIILLEQTGIREIQYYNIDIIQVGSIMIIGSGLLIILMRSRAMRLLGAIMTVGVLIGLGIISFWMSFGPESAIGLTRNIEISSSTNTLGDMYFESIISSFSLDTNLNSLMMTGSILTDRPITYTTGYEYVEYKESPDRNPIQSIYSNYMFSLGKKPIKKLTIKQLYGTNTINVMTGLVNHLIIASSSSSTKLIIGSSMSGAVIDLMGGRINTDVIIAKDVGLAIEYKPARGPIAGGISGLIVADSDPTRFTSSNYISAPHKVTLRINMIMGSLGVTQLP